ncbi:hypothetical protein RXV86_02545 [Alisedimentitalea sp. MJ-SS2]|uniref:hypothetical protein n=1 Tax=Aliisedimentitalea sp. MJ-SS2 TaxID=3049795 RepID=UPI002906CFE7|nr:hypothetical protein [Alisedimentitalea sp. MJ-SS2]MDU8926254.1 hypothetical protein [Alisedimentitalea sp. MJ-SS2]
MEREENTAYQTVLEQLLACGPLKTWSLIVTILGDLAAGDGARVPGPVITQLTEPMGVKPEALRVAIHRLRRDGWITSERDGRTSLYGLTAHGRALTRAVSDRVYGCEAEPVAGWHIVIAQAAEAMQALDHPDMIVIGPRVALLPGDTDEIPANILAWRAEPAEVPDWVRDIAAPEGLEAAYKALREALEAVLVLDLPTAAGPRAVLRLLALHQWRRLVLRHGAGVDALMGPEWNGAKCRARIGTVLALLSRPDPAEL